MACSNNMLIVLRACVPTLLGSAATVPRSCGQHRFGYRVGQPSRRLDQAQHRHRHQKEGEINDRRDLHQHDIYAIRRFGPDPSQEKGVCRKQPKEHSIPRVIYCGSHFRCIEPWHEEEHRDRSKHCQDTPSFESIGPMLNVTARRLRGTG